MNQERRRPALNLVPISGVLMPLAHGGDCEWTRPRDLKLQYLRPVEWSVAIQDVALQQRIEVHFREQLRRVKGLIDCSSLVILLALSASCRADGRTRASGATCETNVGWVYCRGIH